MTNNWVNTSQTLAMPKILPPEARADPVNFTSQSDVWTFGVLLWEIFTLGCVVDFEGCVLNLPEPAFATSAIYSIMVTCWSEKPKDRGSFRALKKVFSGILGESINPNDGCT